ncbi:hypothetical protein PIB30_028190 [Stylosanthes scabra]|uniref:Uncharacterized protein n=1 Tax=Stylosanthes scabra TaxID=79078 RepID=A0ABU6QAG8_9FABA|nr:hypothetical protein [Stylosanthes scabra]
MVNQDEEGVVCSDHSEDERHQNQQQNQQQAGLDLNTTANGSQESAGRNAETGVTQNDQLNQSDNNPGGRRSTNAFDRLGPGHPEPKPFGGIGLDDTQIMQDLRHHMQAMELELDDVYLSDAANVPGHAPRPKGVRVLLPDGDATRIVPKARIHLLMNPVRGGEDALAVTRG